MTIDAAPIVIIGFGFSGRMVLANLIRATTQPLSIEVIDPYPHTTGAAYDTDQPLHLLNVMAERMGAWADAPGDFYEWITSPEGRGVRAALGLPTSYTGRDYVPRMLYGAYLQSIWQATQAMAAQKHCRIRLIPSSAVAVHRREGAFTVLTARGDAVLASRVVLACGNETRSLYPSLPAARVVQHPLARGALDACVQTAQSIAILGTGLTMVDTLLSLRAKGYRGTVTALSRHGYAPRVHAADTVPYAFHREVLLHHASSLTALLYYIRRCVREQRGDWRAVVDGLRPHTPWLWRKLSVNDQRRFFRRIASLWSVHRHRIAPPIAAMLEAEIAAQQCSVIAAHHLRIAMQQERVLLQWDGGELLADVVINCTGVALDVMQSTNPLLQQLVASQMIVPHATGVGISVDASYRAMGEAYPHLYAMGSLLTGHALETIAVPELRAQAAAIAGDVLTSRIQ